MQRGQSVITVNTIPSVANPARVLRFRARLLENHYERNDKRRMGVGRIPTVVRDAMGQTCGSSSISASWIRGDSGRTANCLGRGSCRDRRFVVERHGRTRQFSEGSRFAGQRQSGDRKSSPVVGMVGVSYAHHARPVAGKTTLFWHGHFATSAAKVEDPELMLTQNNLVGGDDDSEKQPFLFTVFRRAQSTVTG